MPRAMNPVPGEPAKDQVPPGQVVSNLWPVRDLGIKPRVPPEEWLLRVGGSVLHATTFRFGSLTGFAHVELLADLHCVTSWSVVNRRFGGVRLGELLERVAPTTESRFALFRSYDGYTTNLPLEVCFLPSTLLVWEVDGEPLPWEHGGPVRVVVPRLYGWKSAKWIHEITISPEDCPGHWEARGYHPHADPWKEERFA